MVKVETSRVHRVMDIPSPTDEGTLVLRTEPTPEPGPGQVLVRVHAAGVNLADTKQARGGYDMPPGAGTIPGLEIAGEIVACGPGTNRFAVGSNVCALVIGGGYGEYCLVPEGQCLPVPAGLTMIEAAGLPETVFTVYMAMFEVARLVAGETVLVHGGGGGIGTTAIQMAVAAGARVFATAGSDERCQMCTDLGAEYAVNYRRRAFGAELEDLLGNNSVDVVIDTVGAPHVPGNLALLAIGGRLCYLAGDGGREIELNLLPVMQKRLSITGGSLRRRPEGEKARLAREIEHRIWPWVEAGALRPQIGLVLPLEQAEEANRALRERRVAGKVILTTSEVPTGR